MEAFKAAYTELCDDITETCRSCLVPPHAFDSIELKIKAFWEEHLNGGRGPNLESKGIMQFTYQMDKDMYNGIIKMLMPDVFQNMTVLLTQHIRNFAKCYHTWLEEALLDKGPAEFARARIEQATSFGQKLRRHTGLNHLAQAARTVLANPGHITHMLEDYLRIDFANIQEQVKWMCEGCDGSLVAKHEEIFRTMQQARAQQSPQESADSLERWAAWMQGIVSDALGKPKANATAESREKDEERASELLLRWSFVSNLILRDLTLKSAISFGPFHLMRLLCDEYMYYLVETCVAEGGFQPIEHTVGGGPLVGEGTGLEAGDDYEGGEAGAAEDGQRSSTRGGKRPAEKELTRDDDGKKTRG